VLRGETEESETVDRILQSLHKDKSLPISHIECTALTALLMEKVSRNRLYMQVSRPMYKNRDYLHVYPGTMKQIVDLMYQNPQVLGMQFLKTFEKDWAQLHRQQGRADLASKLAASLGNESRLRRVLVSPVDSSEGSVESIRDGIAMATIFVAYQVASRDGEFRTAFDLLFSLLGVYEDLDRSYQQEEQQQVELRLSGDGEYEEGDDDEEEGDVQEEHQFLTRDDDEYDRRF
jgi:hypothetical protein